MKSPFIHVWKDECANRSAGENMALDESLFLSAIETNTVRARFYNWSAPAVTFGYFQQRQTEESVRRMTGGGVVEHGEDLTFTLAYPKGTRLAQTSGTKRYQWVHQAVTQALEAVNFHTKLSTDYGKADGPCFSAPVQWDILDPASGEKIAGGAQRRSRGAVIHQGSIRIPVEIRSPTARWVDLFLLILAGEVVPLSDEEMSDLCKTAHALEIQKYGTPEWNRRA